MIKSISTIILIILGTTIILIALTGAEALHYLLIIDKYEDTIINLEETNINKDIKTIIDCDIAEIQLMECQNVSENEITIFKENMKTRLKNLEYNKKRFITIEKIKASKQSLLDDDNEEITTLKERWLELN